MAQVDIIIPLYNKEKTVARAIRSILLQTVTDWRLLVVDDGSTDCGPDVVRAYDDSRITLIQQQNKGPGAARNAGINAAEAEHVAFLDADDQWYPWYLENALCAIQHNPVGFVGSYYYEWPDQADMTRYWQRRGVRPGVYRITDNLPPRLIEAFVFFFHAGTTLVRRQLALHYGGYYEQRCINGEDTIFFARLVLNEPFMVIGPAAVQHNRQDSGLSITHAHPLNPALINPDIILNGCPKEKQHSARLFVVRWALLTAHHKARNGFREHAVYLLERFPEVRQFRLEYLRCRIEIALTRWMPYWVRFKCRVGPPVRHALKKALIRFGWVQVPPEGS